jgi:ferredoxin|tara:strand:+ start:887 stop:1186 length:300 start_codon:yes stop_codon:yes gene_type:complete
MDCVEVCPVDCFYEGENMLVINPDECIDCGVCVPECPVDAIVQDHESTKTIFDLNEKYSLIWPNITIARPDDVPIDAADWNGVEDKLEKHFSEEPGKGD